MVFVFALAGALVAFIPGASFILIPMELLMLYLIANKHNSFEFPIFLLMGTAIFTISTFLKGLALFLHAIPLAGQIANSLVAFAFIAIIGSLAEKYYRGKAKA
jgi:hypothetical protein